MTTKQARTVHPLAKAVLRQLGGGQDAITSAQDAARHGADSGFGGFTYYTDTCAFTRRQRAKIYLAVLDMAEETGTTCLELIRNFKCLDKPSEYVVALALHGGRVPPELADDVQLVENALAWFALEEVGNALLNGAD